MANPSRPALRATPERTARQTRSPATGQVYDKLRDNSSANTRRSQAASQPRKKSTKSSTANTSKPLVSTRNSSRKRPATAVDADASADARPPTKVTVTQPHGQLLRITNGVPATLGIGEYGVPSGFSTPIAGAPVAGLAPPEPPAATQAQDKRSLRSHDGGLRLKSDLPTYFANYDDIIAGLPEPSDFLHFDTPIYIIDEPIKPDKPASTASPEPSRKAASPARSRKVVAHSPARNAPNASIPSPQSSTAFQVLDFSAITPHLLKDHVDPLADSVYFAQHRRAERKEKQLRNIEKERAMHEKVQLERLLDGLLGPDWLKVMGITGVTDGERKDWEPKRDYFVKEVRALVDKFRVWKEEEKRLRAEKEAAMAAREEESQADTESDITNASSAGAIKLEDREKKPKPPQSRRPPQPHGYLLPVHPPEPKTPFTSFYAKPHLRAAALGKHRHGRNATAFGRPIPDFAVHEFEIPEEYVTADALRDHARKRRRQKRESGAKK